MIRAVSLVQATLKAYAAVERLWLMEQPSRVKHIYLCNCFPGTDAKMVHAALSTSNSSVDQAITVSLKQQGCYTVVQFGSSDMLVLFDCLVQMYALSLFMHLHHWQGACCCCGRM